MCADNMAVVDVPGSDNAAIAVPQNVGFGVGVEVVGLRMIVVGDPANALVVADTAPLLAPDRLTKNVWSASTLRSPLIVTETVCVLTPVAEIQRAGMRDIVVVGVVAVPSEVAKLTVNAAAPPLRDTVKVSIFVPLLPSVIDTSLIETEPAGTHHRW